jgi:hypothetical protein
MPSTEPNGEDGKSDLGKEGQVEVSLGLGGICDEESWGRLLVLLT